MSPSKYVKEAVRICEVYIAKHWNMGYQLLRRAENQFENGYCPELDVSLALKPDEASYYQFLLGVMRWMIKMGHININTKVSLLSSYFSI